MLNVYSRARDGETLLSRSFRAKEFACKDGTDPLFVDSELVQVLQAIRDHFGAPVVITSGYRTAAHNRAVGGAVYSQHQYGRAADIRVSGVPVEHPAVEGVEEVSHYETVTEYPGGGRDVRKVIDVPGVPAQAAWTEQVPVQRYIRYTEEELAAREKERQQAEEAARLPETIASLTCQLTDLQLALCELYEGGGV